MWTHANYLSLSLHHHPACGRGFYKSSSQDLQCSRCPAHSYNDREGSWRCDCVDGYYRALSDPPSVACTSEWAFLNLWSSTFPFLPFYICLYIHKSWHVSFPIPSNCLFLVRYNFNYQKRQAPLYFEEHCGIPGSLGAQGKVRRERGKKTRFNCLVVLT